LELTEDDKKIRKYQQFQVRQMKRDRKPKRKRAYDEEENDSKSKSRGRFRKLTSKMESDVRYDIFKPIIFCTFPGRISCFDQLNGSKLLGNDFP